MSNRETKPFGNKFINKLFSDQNNWLNYVFFEWLINAVNNTNGKMVAKLNTFRMQEIDVLWLKWSDNCLHCASAIMHVGSHHQFDQSHHCIIASCSI